VPATSIALRINANGTGSVEKERTERRRRMRARNLREDERDSAWERRSYTSGTGTYSTSLIAREIKHISPRGSQPAKVLTPCAWRRLWRVDVRAACPRG
jgi:hypothetical protein